MLFYAVALLADVDDNFTQASVWLIAALSIWVGFLPVTPQLPRAPGDVDHLLRSPRAAGHREPHQSTYLHQFEHDVVLALLLRATTSGRRIRIYEVAQPIARLSIIVALAVAGFHKFNRDFIDPAVSCVRQFSSDIASVATGDFLGIGVPPLAFLGLMAVIVGLTLWRQGPNLCWPRIDWAGVAAPVTAILLGMIVLSAMSNGGRSYQLRDLIVFLLAVAVLCWHLVEAPLLIVLRFQWVALCFSLLVHAQLAFLRIVDFQAIAIALLITFVPRDIWKIWNRRSVASIGKIRIYRARLYFFLNLIGALLLLAEAHSVIDTSRPLTAWGLLFIVGLLVMLWPIISYLFYRAILAMGGRAGPSGSDAPVAIRDAARPSALRPHLLFRSPHRRQFFNVQQPADGGRSKQPPRARR